jgi:ankyrin repeat protein
VQGGHTNVIQELVEKGCNLNAVNTYGCTPLHIAAAHGRLESVTLLLGLKAVNVSLTGHNGNISQDRPAYHTENVILSRLKGKSSNNIIVYCGSNALHCGVQSGSAAIIQKLIERGYCVNAVTNNGCSPLHLAAALGQLDAVKELVNHSADTSLNSPMHGTPLHQAALYGHTSIVCYMVEIGCEVNAVDPLEYNVLHYAAEGGHEQVIRELVNRGGNVMVKSVAGGTPLHAAGYHGKKEAVLELIDLGAPKSLSSGRCGTVLHQAALGGHLHVVVTLIRLGSSLTAVCSQGYSIVHSAASGGCLEVIKEVVKHACKLYAHPSKVEAFVAEYLTPVETSIITGQGCNLESIYSTLESAINVRTHLCMSTSLLSVLSSEHLLIQDRILHLAAIAGDAQFIDQFFQLKPGLHHNVECEKFTVKTLRYVADSFLPSDLLLPESGLLTPLHVSLFIASGLRAGKYRFHAHHRPDHLQFISKLIFHPLFARTVNMLLPTGHSPLDLARKFGLQDIVSLLKQAGGCPGVADKIPPSMPPAHQTVLAKFISSLNDLKACDQNYMQAAASILSCYQCESYRGIQLHVKPEIQHLCEHVVPRVASRWFQIGVQIGIKSFILDIIEKDHGRHSCEEACQRMFQRWLRREAHTGTQERTWKTVVDALNKVVGKAIVEKIDKDMGKVTCHQDSSPLNSTLPSSSGAHLRVIPGKVDSEEEPLAKRKHF